jgi:hypothetical protein
MLASKREKRNTYRLLIGKPKGKRLLERCSHRVEIILKWILRKQEGRMWAVFIWLRIGTCSVINHQVP